MLWRQQIKSIWEKLKHNKNANYLTCPSLYSAFSVMDEQHMCATGSSNTANFPFQLLETVNCTCSLLVQLCSLERRQFSTGIRLAGNRPAICVCCPNLAWYLKFTFVITLNLQAYKHATTTLKHKHTLFNSNNLNLNSPQHQILWKATHKVRQRQAFLERSIIPTFFGNRLHIGDVVRFKKKYNKEKESFFDIYKLNLA